MQPGATLSSSTGPSSIELTRHERARARDAGADCILAVVSRARAPIG
jgi:hypothetical protein